MKTRTKRNIIYYAFKVASIIAACALPLWGIFEKYPLWVEKHGSVRSIGTGGLIGIVILLVVFRKTIFNFLKDRWKMTYAPPITIWIILIVVSYLTMFVSKFLFDLTTILWMGLVGSMVGGVLTFIGENFFGEEKSNE